MIRFDSIGPDDVDFTYDDAQHLKYETPFQVDAIMFAVGKTAYGVLPTAIKDIRIEDDPGPDRILVLRTHIGPEFRLKGEMAERVMGSLRARGLVA